MQREEESDSTNAEATETLAKLNAATTTCLEICDRLNQRSSKATAPVAPVDIPQMARFRANDGLKPKELSLGFPPRNFAVGETNLQLTITAVT